MWYVMQDIHFTYDACHNNHIPLEW